MTVLGPSHITHAFRRRFVRAGKFHELRCRGGSACLIACAELCRSNVPVIDFARDPVVGTHQIGARERRGPSESKTLSVGRFLPGPGVRTSVLAIAADPPDSKFGLFIFEFAPKIWPVIRIVKAAPISPTLQITP
jgi:hypothetical protein